MLVDLSTSHGQPKLEDEQDKRPYSLTSLLTCCMQASTFVVVVRRRLRKQHFLVAQKSVTFLTFGSPSHHIYALSQHLQYHLLQHATESFTKRDGLAILKYLHPFSQPAGSWCIDTPRAIKAFLCTFVPPACLRSRARSVLAEV